MARDGDLTVEVDRRVVLALGEDDAGVEVGVGDGSGMTSMSS